MKCAATASLLLAAWSPECADWVEALGAMVDGGDPLERGVGEEEALLTRICVDEMRLEAGKLRNACPAVLCPATSVKMALLLIDSP
ncbi:hypothetical protein PF004_g29523 [Phytophthora fragariae]|uniref:Secreted protein n=1 Tax=Phytophthora fragariae TaxID=53985 RepID=A0A6G0MEU8_9STRA|nr:hypothetical protein PF004_g29523 [Phytophthora fragariae]